MAQKVQTQVQYTCTHTQTETCVQFMPHDLRSSILKADSQRWETGIHVATGPIIPLQGRQTDSPSDIQQANNGHICLHKKKFSKAHLSGTPHNHWLCLYK